MSLSLTAIVLTKNEEIHIERCITALSLVASRIVIIDSFSDDATIDIARNLGAEVFQHAFVNHAAQFQWALDNCEIKTNWVMKLDADEVFDDSLAHEIHTTIPKLPSDVTGVQLRRRHYFQGDWVRYGGRYPLILLRIWRNGYGRVEQRWMDEHVVLKAGKTITLSNDFSDNNLLGIGWWCEKHIGYATREAIDVLVAESKFFRKDSAVAKGKGGRQARIRRWVKSKIYNKLPFLLGPILYFLFRFTFQGGFMDSRGGRTYHLMQGLWYRTLVDVRKRELKMVLDRHDNQDSQILALEKETQLPIRKFYTAA
ncbi:glycosyltransferase family 2 protein [Pyruvatibacter sp.]